MPQTKESSNSNDKKNTPDSHEVKSFKFELEKSDENGEFWGHAAVFGNVDSGGDLIEKGAFAKTIKEDFDRIKILSQHNDCELPIGKPLELREDEKGLFIHGKISDTQKGRDIQTLLKDGVLNELSIGYDAVVYDYDTEQDVRHLKEIKLWEVSIVTWAMNEEAKIDEVKSLAEELQNEVKSGKISRAKLDSLKPFISVLRELVEILSPFLEPPIVEENATQDNVKQTAVKPDDVKQTDVKVTGTKKTQNTGMIFKIIPSKTGGN